MLGSTRPGQQSRNLVERRFGWGRLLAVAPALALLACSSATPVADPDRDPEAVTVRLIRIGAGADMPERVATGTVRLRRETPLAFIEAGRITSIGVREGDRVSGGQLLARLDSVTFDSAVTAAEAEKARAAAELARQRKLLAQGWVAQARVDSAAATARAADAQLAGRRFSQQFASIHAPSSGIILQRLAEPGETLAAGTPVLVLGETGSGHVLRVGVAAADVSGLTAGTVADIRFRDGAAPGMRGTVIEVAGRADPRTGTFQVEFALPDDASLRSGMIAEARWRNAGTQAGPTFVPATALFSVRAGEGFVWRLDSPSGRVGARLVKLGAVTDRGVTVLEGLVPGDRIVAGGVDRLVEGQRVRTVAAT